MPKLPLLSLLLLLGGAALAAEKPADFPIVPDDLKVALFAKEPLVRNPCAMAFDARGRLCVGMGPQYRTPQPDTPGDSVWILIDDDGDGVADRRVQFATGFNAIQSLAWHGRDLWVANSPDLTIVRDLNGDDVADEYVRVYTDLGNLEHALHGLNFAPDGKLYMSKGNSKGMNQPGRVAPKPFRDLWGQKAPAGAADMPAPVVFKRGEYQKNFHDPKDDWGLSGGVLRCDADGQNLEIVSRGLRNPWDIAYDTGFNWLGTDNDQTGGDKIFSPFYGANFGWGHPWSFSWKDDNHLPTAPSSGPFFEGSGTGIIFNNLGGYPDKYRGVFFIDDWLKRQVYIYRPRWDGARMMPDKDPMELLAHADRGRSMKSSDGVAFDPVDIEMGPDGAIWIASWGRQYGAEVDANGEQTNEGRIYRIWPKEAFEPSAPDPKRALPHDQWTFEQLLADLTSQLPVWRIEARDELVRRGEAVRQKLRDVVIRPIPANAIDYLVFSPPEAEATWCLWTLASLEPTDDFFTRFLDTQVPTGSDSVEKHVVHQVGEAPNVRIQALRILAFRAHARGETKLPAAVAGALGDADPRLRHEAVLAIHQAKDATRTDDLLALAAKEQDRLTFYSTWQALRALAPVEQRKHWLADARGGVRRAALLGLLEEDALTEDEIKPLAKDADAATAELATMRLGGKTEQIVRGAAIEGVVSSEIERKKKKETEKELAKKPAPAMHPGPAPTKAAEVLPLLAQADAEHGRLLFLHPQGAGCFACHRLEGVGNVFAPDLSEISTRADAAFVTRSILEPSADITEGFAMQTFLTKDGGGYAGIVIEETARSVKVAMAGGVVVEVQAKDIVQREAMKISAMPEVFAAALGPQDVADLVAFLLHGVPEVKHKKAK